MYSLQPPPHILLVNPWITDFAAYNFWIKPLGLLSIAGLLRECGFRVTLIDCLDSYQKIKKYGDGKFFKTRIEKPPQLKTIPRHYSQYGIPEEMLVKRFSMIEEKPDLIAISSGMSYWYPGAFKLIELVKKIFKGVVIVLGGIYATLCYEHARVHSGADFVFNGGNEREVLKLFSELTGFSLRTPCLSGRQANSELRANIYPAFDLYPGLDYVCISSTRGCPYHCTYCASPKLSKGFMRREPLKVVDEIEHWTGRHKVSNVAFYDDALLVEPSKHFIPMMKEVIKRGIRCNFHTPNALHIREIDKEVAHLLHLSCFKTIRLGFETSNEATQVETGGKVNNHDLQKAVGYLGRAGYSDREIGVYVMAGLPGQRAEEVEEDIAFVREAGAEPILVEYSPIPHTPLFDKAKKFSRFDLENEPLYHNNSILPCQWEGFTLGDLKKMKDDLGRR